MGELVDSIVINKNKQIYINFSQFQSGTYIIRLQCNQEVRNYKLTKS
ncbi:MAG: hypothetical protein NTW25_16185 [Candidatus Kapabacteria bacterium]|nr:hypothetical protein [Candidatus Kapabacteria bacterium]